MTYTTPQDFSEPQAFSPSSVQSAPSTAKKLKTLAKESLHRSQRIAKIVQVACNETAVEFQAGRAVITPLAKEVTAETVATVKAKSQQAQKTVNTVWQQEADAEDVMDRLIRFVRVLAVATQEKLFPQLQNQVVKLDNALSDRYGSQYENFKNRFDFARASYTAPEQTTPETETDGSTAIEVNSEVIR